MGNLVHHLMHETSPRILFMFISPLFMLLVLCCLPKSTAKRASSSDARHGRRHLLPPSPPGLPIIGHLHLVGALPHVSLRDLAKKNGPDLMLLQLGLLGARPTLVASSPRAAEAVLRTHDHVFSSRPRSVLADVIFYGSSDIAFAPYGQHWRQAKRILTTHLLSAKKVQAFRLAREEEVSIAIAKVRRAVTAGVAVDMGELTSSFINDVVCRAVSGRLTKDKGRNKLFEDLVRDTSQLINGFNIERYFPVLAKVGVLGKATRAKAERVKKRWDDILDKLIEDHERNYNTACHLNNDDFIYILLSLRQEYGLTRECMKAILVDVFFGGTDTSAQTLEFTIAELMRKPHVMNKLQAELRSTTPKEQKIVSEIDMNHMTYLKAVIKEGLRLHPVVPLLAPHLSMEDCNIDGYMIPQGTRLFINVWAIGRDERFWDSAEEFRPERFLDDFSSTACVNFKGSDFQYLPFGSGRRMCPGMNFGITSVEIMLANLMCNFDWVTPSEMEIDMSEVFGLTVTRKEKLLLLPKLLG